MKKGLRGVPAFVVGNESFVGLDIQKLMQLIDYKIINCPHCKQRLRVPKDKKNLKITCQKCKNNFIV